MNYALIAALAAVFLYQVSLGSAVEALIRAHGFVPGELARALDARGVRGSGPELATIATSMFLHGGWFHVIFNVLYLRVFGDNVEDRFGHLVFLLFYLASGAAGAIGHAAFGGAPEVPMVGASGAIAGVLGAYIVLFPAARVLTLFPVFIFLTFIEVPAFVFVGIWALQQLLNGWLVLAGAPEHGGIAWFAHLGGFALGVVSALVYRALHRRRRPAVAPPSAPPA